MRTQPIQIGELFAQTWTQYKQQAIPLLLIILAATVIICSLALAMILCGVLAATFSLHLMPDNTAAIAVASLFITLILLAITILLIWCQAAMIALVADSTLNIIEATRKGWKMLWPMTWVLTFYTGILITGFLFGLVPGLIFLVWFSFAMFILFAENRRGLDALLASREYVRGYGLDTFAKLFVIWLVSGAIAVAPFVGQVLSMFFTPFLLLFIFGMYKDLKSIKGEAPITAGAGTRLFWWIVTIIGLLIPIAALLGLLYLVLTGEGEWMHNSWQSMGGTNV